MPDRTLAHTRLVAQGLAAPLHSTPTRAVAAMGAMQGQDLAGAIASAALRTVDGTVEQVLTAFDAGELVRGYPMRGTVFLAPAADLRWMTDLCAGPALRAAAQRRARVHDFTDADIERAFEAVAPLAAGRGLSRAEFQEVLRGIGIDPAGGRAYHILTTLIQQSRLVYGPWNGVDQQVVLGTGTLGPGLDDRFSGDETAAIAEFAARYFRTRGPATVADFAWWSKLGLTRIRRALPLMPDDVEHLGDETWGRAGILDELAGQADEVARPMLLPGFDEFILGYRDRLFAMSPATHEALVPGNNGVFRKSVVVDGIVRGFWSRGGRPGKRTLDIADEPRVPKSVGPALRRRFAAFPFVGD